MTACPVPRSQRRTRCSWLTAPLPHFSLALQHEPAPGRHRGQRRAPTGDLGLWVRQPRVAAELPVHASRRRLHSRLPPALLARLDRPSRRAGRTGSRRNVRPAASRPWRSALGLGRELARVWRRVPHRGRGARARVPRCARARRLHAYLGARVRQRPASAVVANRRARM